MRHQNTVIHGLLKVLPRWQFDRVVEQHRGDYEDRRLTFWSHFVSLIYAQVSSSQSLRDLIAALGSHENLLYHLGARKVRRSTLSDANRDRPVSLFAAIFDLLLARATGVSKQDALEAVRVIDSTSMHLNETLSSWAHWSSKSSGVKLHLTYDPKASVPTYFSITPVKVNDVVEGQKLPLEPGATYVFDLGYYDFGWWGRLDDAGCRFVTRLKVNTPLTVVAEMAVEKGGTIISDRIGCLPERQARSRRNPMQGPVREVHVRIDTGEILRLVCNDIDTPAEEIAELYKMRWQIELFFKWVKQNLRIKKFLGTSENAVKLQIITAVITYLLIHIAHRAWSCALSLQNLTRLIRANLMHRKSIADLIRTTPKPPPNPQLALLFSNV